MSPTYDGNSNLTFDGTFSFGYDAENRLTSASGAGNTVAYAWDAQGRRKTRTVNGATTVFVTDAANREVLEYDGSSGAIQRWYAYGPGANDVVNQTNVVAGTRAALVPDIQGSVIASLDSVSGTFSKIGYLPYGKSASATAPFGYTGQRIDPETNGLYYYRARHYSPAWGRFLQVDPVGYGGGSNLYAYVNNDPLNLIDPFGLSPDSPLTSAAKSFYNNVLAPPVNDISDLINNPSQIPGAIASVAPGLGPIAELPQAISGMIGAAKGISSIFGAAGAGSSAPTEYNYTSTVEQNAATRPYINSPLTIQEITSTGAGVPDPGGIPGALRYDVPGTMSRPGAPVGAPNATVTGSYELVIDPNSNTVYHFLFKSGP